MKCLQWRGQQRMWMRKSLTPFCCQLMTGRELLLITTQLVLGNSRPRSAELLTPGHLSASYTGGLLSPSASVSVAVISIIWAIFDTSITGKAYDSLGDFLKFSTSSIDDPSVSSFSSVFNFFSSILMFFSSMSFGFIRF